MTLAKGKGFSLVRSETNKAAFERAFKINPDAAVRATSWGAGQVLGGHLISLYKDPESAVREFYSNPERVSRELIVQWLKSNPKAVIAANNLDFKELARLYNGPNYKVNNYDEKIKNKYQQLIQKMA